MLTGWECLRGGCDEHCTSTLDVEEMLEFNNMDYSTPLKHLCRARASLFTGHTCSVCDEGVAETTCSPPYLLCS